MRYYGWREFILGEALWIGCIFSDRARPRARVNKITFSKKNFNMKDVTVPLSGEVFWIEQIVARHWERVEV